MVSLVDCKTVLANGTSQTKPKRNRVNSIGENALLICLYVYIILYVCMCRMCIFNIMFS
ncbi:Uncharacterized protein FWK35_00038985 [Aphis craccivora]|uniref:Uncharacterized protein n=1 Tax=Aphis craccivora TaxID=307492 RepID=A0A6G0YDH4_APHCR|nr:Uncharacterized protein FWK35_00038985 [Aphis craccivora]